MNIIKTAIPGLLVIEPKIHRDNRGFFTEIFQAERYAACGIGRHFVQDNFSRSANRTLRGLHFQNPRPQGKLLTVLRGSVFDVAVDVRIGSPAFGKHVELELNDENRRQVWIPRGIAHGFVVRSDFADVFYKCDDFYSPEDEKILRWNDPALGIDWNCTTPILSARDSGGHSFAELRSQFPHYEPA